MNIKKYAESCILTPRKIAGILKTTSFDVARSAGLGRDAIRGEDRLRSPGTQAKLRNMVKVLEKAESRFGNVQLAYAWYRSEAISGCSGLTAMQLVWAGRTEDVLTCIDAIEAGVFA